MEKTYVDRHLAEPRAHPTRPFAITDVQHDDTNPTVTIQTGGSFQQLPAMLAWLAAWDGGSPRPHLRVQSPMPDRQTLCVDLICGIVTRCELQSAAMMSFASV